MQYHNPEHLAVRFGNEMTPTQVQRQPAISWPVEEGALYTLVMTGR